MSPLASCLTSLAPSRTSASTSGSRVSEPIAQLTNCTGQRYLPPDWMITKDFIRQVLAAEKELLKMSELRQVNVPKYDELSVKNLFPNL